MGGTIASLRGYVNNRGGKVVAEAVMSAHENALHLPIKAQMLAAINYKHGSMMNQFWQKEFGYGIEELTEGEAGHVRHSKTVDEIRDRITQARHERILSLGKSRVEETETVQTEYLNFNYLQGIVMDKKTSMAKVIADELIELLEKGVAPWQKPFKPGEFPFPYNVSTGNNYKGVNNLFLMQARNFDDARWLTYRQAFQLGAQVRKGEHGRGIIFWTTTKEVKNKDGTKTKIELDHPVIVRSTVFNAEQIDGMPPEKCE